MENKNNNEEKNNVNVNQNEKQELEADVKNQNNQHGELQDAESQTNLADANLNNGKTNQLQDTISMLNNIRVKKSAEIENKKIKIKNKSKKIKIISGVVAGVAVVGIAATIICVSLFGKKTYQLTINYGDGTTENVEINKDGKVTNLKEPEVFGYKFDGWFKDAGFNIPFNPDTDNISSNTTIYAKLTPKIYKINFLSNNATMQSNSVDVAYNQSYSLPENTFVNNNYKFMGWSLNPNATNEVEIFSPGKAFKLIDEGATYYAIWKGEEKTISYNIQDLRINGTKPTIINTVLNYGDEYTIPNLEELHNGTSNHKDYNKYFLGFKIDGDETNKIYTYGNKLTITNSFHFLEVWQDCTNMLTLQLQGGQTSGQTSYNFVTGHKIKLPNATRENYDFMGWNTKSDGSGTSYLANSEYVIKNSTSDKLYAIWKGQEKQISFEFTNARVNGELPTIEISTVNYDNNFTIPTLTGVEHKDKSMYFAGFTIKNDNSGKVYTMGETIKVTQNIVFVEAWEASTNLIKFNLQGGTGNFNNINFVTGTEINLPESIPTLANYVFMGWNTLSNGLGTMYAAGESYTVQEGIFTLYAIWKGEEKTLSFNFTDGLFNIDGVDTPANEILTNKTINYGDNYTVESFDGIHVVGYDYNFIGVKIKDSADATVYAPGETITITGNITLVDVWEKTSNVLNIVNTFDNSIESYNYITGYSFELGVLVPPYFYEEIGFWSGTEESIPETKEQIMASPYFISNGGTITITDGTQNIYAVYVAVEMSLTFSVYDGAVDAKLPEENITKNFKYNSLINLSVFSEFSNKIPENVTNNWNFMGWGVYGFDSPNNYFNVFSDGQNITYNLETFYNVKTLEEFVILVGGGISVDEAYSELIQSGWYLGAVWEHKQTTITYNANGGTYDEGFESVQNVNTSSYISLPTSGVSKQYHNLIGWSTSPTDQSTVLKSYTTGLEGTTLYAVYERKQVDVSFSVGNGASSGINPFKHGMGLNYELPLNGNLFTKEGYEVVGFSANGTTYGFGDSVLITENTVISVIWEETQIVKFMNATPENIYFEGGQKISKLTASSVGKTLIMPSVVLDEKEKDVNGTIKYFAGWSTNANDTVPMYFQASSYVITNTKITLYPIYLEETLDCLQFTLNADNESYTVTSNSSSTSSYTLPYMVIPSTYNGKPVNTIQELDESYACVIETAILPNSITKVKTDSLFGYNLSSKIKYVYIPGSLSHFKKRILSNDYSSIFKTVVFGEGLEILGNCYEGFSLSAYEFVDPSTGTAYIYNAGASNLTSATTVVLPDTLKEIGNQAIAYNDNLKSIVLPDNLEKIWDSAFLNNIFDELTIPANVKFLGEGIAARANVPKSVELNVNNNSYYMIENNMLLNKETTRLLSLMQTVNQTTFTVPSTIQTIDAAAIMGIETLQKVVVGSNVKKIGEFSLSMNINLTTIELPSQVESIGENAFIMNPKLTTINWPENIHEIPAGAFSECESLVFNIPNHITKIGESVFEANKALTEVTIPGSVKEIGRFAFSNCSNLAKFIMEYGVEKINERIFGYYDGHYVSHLEIPASVITIVSEAFSVAADAYVYCDVVSKPAGWDSSWINGIASENIHWIQVNFALNADGNSYTVTSPVNTEISGKFIIPKSHNGLPVTGIGDSAFESCSNITEIVIPDSVTTIGNFAFKHLRLAKIEIPASVTYIGEGIAFRDPSAVPVEIVLNNNSNYIIENHMLMNKEKTRLLNLLHSFTNPTFTVPSTIQTIDSYAIVGFSTLENLVFGNSVKKIGYSSIVYNFGLTTIELPSQMESIGESAFASNSKLTTINWPENIHEMPDFVFSSCESLVFNIPNHITKIGEGAFSNNKALTEVTIPGSVKEIGRQAFYGSYNINKFIIENGVQIIRTDLFGDYGKYCITYLEIPASVTTIEQNAFSVTADAYVYCDVVSKPAGWDSSWITGIPAENIHWKQVNYTLNESGTGYVASAVNENISGEVVIPETYRGLPVTEIAASAFANCGSITKIVIPNSVSEIGNYAFNCCSSLATVNLPTNLTTIESHAFSGCIALKEIAIPSGVTEIGNYAFDDCTSLATVNLPTSLTTIGEYAFQNCRALTEIAIPSGVTEIGNYAFYDCTSLAAVSLPENLTTIGEGAFQSCNALTEITIPNSVTAIGNYAFYCCLSLTTISLPTNLTTIGNFTFNSCRALKEIVIPNTVTQIGECAFYDCTSLATVNLPTNLTTIGRSAFEYCSSLTEIAIPSGVTIIEQNTFQGCSSLTTVNLPTNLTTIGEYAFQNCRALKEIVIPNTVTQIGECAFYDCTSLAKIEIPASVTTIGEYAFSNPNMQIYCDVVSEPAGWSASGWFYGIPLENIHWKQVDFVLNGAGTGYVASAVNKSISGEVVIPETYNSLPVTEIAASAFEDCSNITKVVIPNSVTEIGSFAFNRCSSLVTVSLPTNLTTIGNEAFRACSALTEIAIPSGVTAIGKSTFYNCTSLVTVSLPTNLTTIGESAFQECRALTEIAIPNGVTAIEPFTFYYCGKLAKVNLPTNLTTIGNQAFQECKTLTEITIPNGVTEIGKHAFSGTSLAKVEIPASVTTIGDGVFTNKNMQIYCDVVSKPAGWSDTWASGAWGNVVPAENIHWKQLNFVLNGAGTGYVASAAADNISGEVIIPETYNSLPVTEIGASAFANCGSITKIIIPNSVTKIGDSAFAYCTSLERLDIPESVEYMGASIFESRTEVQIYCEAISKPAGWSDSWATVVPIDNIHWGVAMQSNVNDVAMPKNNNLETNIANLNLSKTVVNSETKNENKRGN